MVRALSCAERIELLVAALANERHYRRALLEELRDELDAFRRRHVFQGREGEALPPETLAAAERLTLLEPSVLS